MSSISHRFLRPMLEFGGNEDDRTIVIFVLRAYLVEYVRLMYQFVRGSVPYKLSLVRLLCTTNMVDRDPG